MKYNFKWLGNKSGKLIKFAPKICLVGSTLVSINSMDMGNLGGFDFNKMNTDLKNLNINELKGVADGFLKDPEFKKNVVKLTGSFLGEPVLNVIGGAIFNGKGNDVIPVSNKDKLCILFHGLSDTAENFHSVIGKEIAEKFGCDVISLEYNNFDIKRIEDSANELVKKITGIEGIKNKEIIIFGYSLGVNVASVVANILKAKGFNFDFIGYKGYADLYSVAKSTIVADAIVRSGIKGAAEAYKSNVDDFIHGIAESNNTIRELIGITDNSKQLIKLGLQVEICNGNLGEGHLPRKADVNVIHTAYVGLKNDDKNKHFILLCQANKDKVVGNGMKETYDRLKSGGGNGNESPKKDGEGNKGGTCDCYSSVKTD